LKGWTVEEHVGGKNVEEELTLSKAVGAILPTVLSMVYELRLIVFPHNTTAVIY